LKKEAKILKLNSASLERSRNETDVLSILNTYYRELLKIDDIIPAEIKESANAGIKNRR
jgi:hypothetical protein